MCCTHRRARPHDTQRRDAYIVSLGYTCKHTHTPQNNMKQEKRCALLKEMEFCKPGEGMHKKHDRRRCKRPQRLAEFMKADIKDETISRDLRTTYIPRDMSKIKVKRKNAVSTPTPPLHEPKRKKACPMCRKKTGAPILLYKDEPFECTVCIEEFNHLSMKCVLACGHLVCDTCWHNLPSVAL